MVNFLELLFMHHGLWKRESNIYDVIKNSTFSFHNSAKSKNFLPSPFPHPTDSLPLKTEPS